MKIKLFLYMKAKRVLTSKEIKIGFIKLKPQLNYLIKLQCKGQCLLDEEREFMNIFKCNACAACNSPERIFAHVNR